MGRNFGLKSFEDQEEEKRVEKWVGIFIGVLSTCAIGLVIIAAWVFFL